MIIPVGLAQSTVLPSMDFETYSEAGYIIDPLTGKVRGAGNGGKGGLKVVGTPIYAAHPSAEVLCLYYDLKDGRGRRGWLPGTPDPVDLIEHIRAGGLIEAWNVTFEFYIWNLVGCRLYGWPPLPLEQCRCVMARSRRYSTPGALAKAAVVLGTKEKDKAGTALIRKLTRPHAHTKKRPAIRWTTATAWDDFLSLYAYCDVDVESEDEAAARIPDLSPAELEVWQLDQRINVRGVQVDTPALTAALRILAWAEDKYNNELRELTGGIVTEATKLPALQAWLGAQGVDMPNMQAETISDTLKAGGLPPQAKRALEIRETLGAANVKKLITLSLQIGTDGRLRDQYMYCGADRSGRWSAGGVQLQNITAKGPKTSRCGGCGGIHGQSITDIGCPRCGQWVDMEALPEWTVEAVGFAIDDIIAAPNVEHIVKIWGDPIALLCGCLRGLFTAKQGHDLMCVDFSAIEAVVAACISRCQWRIDVFSTHGKIYEESAAKATGIPLEEILQYKIDTGMSHPARKGVGKIRELAGSYGGWIGAWKNFGAEEYFETEDDIKADVLKWRAESPEIEDMWGGQYRWCGPGKWDYKPELFGLEGCAIQAIRNPGQWYQWHDIAYGVTNDILYCRLPSGRFLHYHRPRLHAVPDKLNRGPSVQITFEGYNSNSTKGPIGWHRLETYGGRLFENVVQAIARDIQAEAMVRVEKAGYPIVMHTHDEITVEIPEGWGTLEHMTELLIVRPSWAEWWPIRAAGWRHKRYQKD